MVLYCCNSLAFISKPPFLHVRNYIYIIQIIFHSVNIYYIYIYIFYFYAAKNDFCKSCASKPAMYYISHRKSLEAQLRIIKTFWFVTWPQWKNCHYFSGAYQKIPVEIFHRVFLARTQEMLLYAFLFHYKIIFQGQVNLFCHCQTFWL